MADITNGIHVDQHTLAFMPGNPQELFSGNDGGVYRSINGTQTPPVWASLNNGYYATQFYEAGIDRNDTTSLAIIGGMQDNGTYTSYAPVENDQWIWLGGGDGGTCALSGGGTVYYYSLIYGGFTAYRDSADGATGNPLWWTRIDPAGAEGMLWLNPFVLDPNDPESMYFGGGTSLWRNSNLANIPHANQNSPTGVDWIQLADADSTSISAIGVATTPANRVYYGTETGDVYRMDNATGANPVPVDLSAGAQFPAGGFVSSIAVDPENGNDALVVFSNFNVQSLFYTTNAGATWDSVGGNLEQFPDGTGDGPSCRVAAIIHVGGGVVYLVGTTAGLYSTAVLQGMATVWVLEGASVMGNAIVDGLDARSGDGFVAVGTHGSGMFSGYMKSEPNAVEERSQIPLAFILNQNYPNPCSATTTLQYTLPDNGSARIALYNVLGDEVRMLASGMQSAGAHVLTFDAAGLPDGVYFCRLGYKGITIEKSVTVVR